MTALKLAAAVAALFALGACGKSQKAEDDEKVYEGSGKSFDGAVDDVVRKMDEARAKEGAPCLGSECADGAGEGWVELGPEEGADAVREALSALDAIQASADKRPGAAIAAAIDAYRHGAGARGYFDHADFPYRPSEYGQITELPANAASDGITGAAGLLLDAANGPFKTALVSYLVFDDAANAVAYREKLDRNFTQSMIETASFDLTSPDSGPIEVRCVFIPDTDNSVNCHHKGPGGRIVATTLFAGGPYLDFSGDERAIDLVFADPETEKRIMDVIAEEAAYLFDALQR